MKIFTIGHSDRAFDDFVSALGAFDIEKLVDVRSLPGSRYAPQFNRETLSEQLAQEGIEYTHFPLLGGRRKGPPGGDTTLVMGWRNASFRNYAAYSLTEDYAQGIDKLMEEDKTICLMCAERVPWKCHRLLISNTLITKGVEVVHIVEKNKSIVHRLNLYGAYAELYNGRIIYPSQPPQASISLQ